MRREEVGKDLVVPLVSDLVQELSHIDVQGPTAPPCQHLLTVTLELFELLQAMTAVFGGGDLALLELNLEDLSDKLGHTPVLPARNPRELLVLLRFEPDLGLVQVLRHKKLPERSIHLHAHYRKPTTAGDGTRRSGLSF